MMRLDTGSRIAQPNAGRPDRLTPISRRGNPHLDASDTNGSCILDSSSIFDLHHAVGGIARPTSPGLPTWAAGHARAQSEAGRAREGHGMGAWHALSGRRPCHGALPGAGRRLPSPGRCARRRVALRARAPRSWVEPPRRPPPAADSARGRCLPRGGGTCIADGHAVSFAGTGRSQPRVCVGDRGQHLLTARSSERRPLRIPVSPGGWGQQRPVALGWPTETVASLWPASSTYAVPRCTEGSHAARNAARYSFSSSTPVRVRSPGSRVRSSVSTRVRPILAPRARRVALRGWCSARQHSDSSRRTCGAAAGSSGHRRGAGRIRGTRSPEGPMVDWPGDDSRHADCQTAHAGGADQLGRWPRGTAFRRHW